MSLKLVTTGYVTAFIRPMSPGAARYTFDGVGGPTYKSLKAAATQDKPDAYLTTHDPNWQQGDPELVQAIQDVYRGWYSTTPPNFVLAASRDADGVMVFGIDTVECYQRPGGELDSIEEYDPAPGSGPLSEG